MPRNLVCCLGLATALVTMQPAHAQQAAPRGLHDACIETELTGCAVTGAGVASLLDGTRIAWQYQFGEGAAGPGSGVILFHYSEPEADWILFARAFDAFQYRLPTLAEGEPPVLHIPGYQMGTGGMNADLLFTYDAAADRWWPVDIGRWQDSMDDWLPAGFEIWKGVDYDFAEWFYGQYTARTPLWRGADANCCPSGGEAVIRFGIRDHALTVTGIDLIAPRK